MIERFDVLAPSVNRVYNLFRSEHLRRYAIAADFLADMPADRLIVDAASGCGYGYDYLAPLGRYVGLDCSAEAAASSRVRYPRGDFRVADLDNPATWHAMAAGAVVSLETAEHLQSPVTFLLAAHSVLPRGGRFVFSAPTSKTMDFDRYHLRDWSASKWAYELLHAGFIIKRVETMPFVATFWQFLAVTPTTWRQKVGVFRFMLRHPAYLLDRLWNWGVLNRFYWESTIYCCVRA